MKDAPNDRTLQEVLKIEGFSRRRFLLGTLLGPSVIPLVGIAAPTPQLAATEESVETENNWEGPFYKPNAPVRSALIEPGMAGTPLTVTGHVLDTNGRPLKGALLDIWQADHTGVYDTPVSAFEDGSIPATMVATRSAPSSRFTTAESTTCAPRTFT